MFLSYAMTEACSSMTFKLLASPTTVSPASSDSCGHDSCSPSHSIQRGFHYGEASGAVSAPRVALASSPPFRAAVCVGKPAAGVEVSVRQSDDLPSGKSLD